MGQPQFDLSAAARLDLLGIWNYLAENASVDVADKVSVDIETAIGEVAGAPGIAHRRPDLTERNILFYRVHSYLILYRPELQPVHILRVFHSARDVKSLLDEHK